MENNGGARARIFVRSPVGGDDDIFQVFPFKNWRFSVRTTVPPSLKQDVFFAEALHLFPLKVSFRSIKMFLELTGGLPQLVV